MLEAVEESAGIQVIAATEAATDIVAALQAQLIAWVRLAGDLVAKRIPLIDAPAVLRWERWRAMDEANALGSMKTTLQEVADAGRLPPACSTRSRTS